MHISSHIYTYCYIYVTFTSRFQVSNFDLFWVTQVVTSPIDSKVRLYDSKDKDFATNTHHLRQWSAIKTLSSFVKVKPQNMSKWYMPKDMQKWMVLHRVFGQMVGKKMDHDGSLPSLPFHRQMQLEVSASWADMTCSCPCLVEDLRCEGGFIDLRKRTLEKTLENCRHIVGICWNLLTWLTSFSISSPESPSERISRASERIKDLPKLRHFALGEVPRLPKSHPKEPELRQRTSWECCAYVWRWLKVFGWLKMFEDLSPSS